MLRTFSIIFLLVVTIWAGSAMAAISPQQPCGIENCHGMEISCGPDVPQVCTEMYQLGDFCREHARCEIVDGECRLIKDERFLSCKACVEACEQNADPMAAFECEADCRGEADRNEKSSEI